MDIDWSKAPEGATHFNPHSRGFMKIKGSDVCLWVECSDISYWARSSGSFGGFDVRAEDGIPRPTTWTGEGLPPVGTKVTIETNDLRIWKEAEVFIGRMSEVVATFKLIESDMVVVYLEEENACCVFRASMCRLPKTPEQIAAEARSSAVDQMLKDASSTPKCETLNAIMFGALYDAGYRKQPSQQFAEGEREELINHVFKSFNVKLSEAVAIVDRGYRKPTDQ